MIVTPTVVLYPGYGDFRNRYSPFKHGSQTVLLYRVCTKVIILASPLCSNRPGIDGLTGACLCYPVGYMPTTCIMTSTSRDQMTITIGYQNSRQTRAGTHNVVQLIRHYLMSVRADGGDPVPVILLLRTKSPR
jgi:hypothetical protein